MLKETKQFNNPESKISERESLREREFKRKRN